MIQFLQGDCLQILPTLPADSVECCVTDPPYHLTTGKKGGTGPASENLDTPYGRARITTGFMGKAWDGGDIAHRPETWADVLRVVKPGGHLLAFGGTRTFHRLTCAIEDAGWEIRDTLMWVYGSGFPKSLDVSKAIDKEAGVEREVVGIHRTNTGMQGGNFANGGQSGEIDITVPATAAAKQWAGWGTALKPAWEPIILARKPIEGTVAQNVQKHGTGALNIDGCRVNAPDGVPVFSHRAEAAANCYSDGKNGSNRTGEIDTTKGRWPANVIHDGSEEVLACFPDAPGQIADASLNAEARKTQNVYGEMRRGRGDEPSANSENNGDVGFKMRPGARRLDEGSAARFFYTAKASRSERGSYNKHPTVKPLSLMSYLVRLVCPPGGTVLDPFAGSGTTGRAALELGFKAILIDLDPENIKTAGFRCNVTPGLPLC